MGILIHHLWQFCLFRHTPAATPSDSLLCALVLANYLLATATATILVAHFMSAAPDAAANDSSSDLAVQPIFTYLLVSAATLAALVYLACTLRQVKERFLQILTAIFGANLLQTTLSILALLIVGFTYPGLVIAVTFCFAVWSLAVAGYLLARGLNAPMVIGVGFIFSFFLIASGLGAAAAGL